jgi:hypothetical protein
MHLCSETVKDMFTQLPIYIITQQIKHVDKTQPKVKRRYGSLIQKAMALRQPNPKSEGASAAHTIIHQNNNHAYVQIPRELVKQLSYYLPVQNCVHTPVSTQTIGRKAICSQRHSAMICSALWVEKYIYTYPAHRRYTYIHIHI